MLPTFENLARCMLRSTMTAEEEVPQQEKPYAWDESAPPPQDVLTYWQEVGNGIDKNQTGESKVIRFSSRRFF